MRLCLIVTITIEMVFTVLTTVMIKEELSHAFLIVEITIEVIVVKVMGWTESIR